jgi:xanthine dehydrogenase YagS FAD-binding subunit
LPGETPQVDTVLEAGELITAVALPKPIGGRQTTKGPDQHLPCTDSVAAAVQRDELGESRAQAVRVEAEAK